jgi:class 3 adenylate cyclase
VIGTQRLAFDLWGDTVNVASRLQELAPPGRVLVSERTMDLVRDRFVCEPLGESELRGHSGMNTFAIAGPIEPTQADRQRPTSSPDAVFPASTSTGAAGRG